MKALLHPLLFFPPAQGLIVLVLMVICLTICRTAGRASAGWNGSALLILGYALFNAGAGIGTPSPWLYLILSLATFVLLFPAALLLSRLITGLSLDEFGDRAMIFTAPVLYYPLFLGIMGLIRLVKGLFVS